MSVAGTFLDQMRSAMQAQFENRVCVRDLQDFGDREEADLIKGVFTFLADGLPAVADDQSYLGVMLVGQVFAGEDACPSALEEAELTMVEEILALKRAANVEIEVQVINTSRQLETPYGWVRAQLRVGPLDLTPPLPESGLDDFLTFNAQWDVPPKTTSNEHQDWLDGDYADSVPDAEDTVTLEQA